MGNPVFRGPGLPPRFAKKRVQYLPLDDAERMIEAAARGSERSSLDMLEVSGPGNRSGRSGNGAGVSGSGQQELSLDLDSWQLIGFPPAVLAAVVACKHGVTRAHLVDKDIDGALLLELYTRDGTHGVCMIAGDIYQGNKQCNGSCRPSVMYCWKPEHCP